MIQFTVLVLSEDLPVGGDLCTLFSKHCLLSSSHASLCVQSQIDIYKRLWSMSCISCISLKPEVSSHSGVEGFTPDVCRKVSKAAGFIYIPNRESTSAMSDMLSCSFTSLFKQELDLPQQDFRHVMNKVCNWVLNESWDVLIIM